MLLPKLYFFSQCSKKTPCNNSNILQDNALSGEMSKDNNVRFLLCDRFWFSFVGIFLGWNIRWLYCFILPSPSVTLSSPCRLWGLFFFLLIIQIHCPYLIKSNNWSYTQLYQPDPSGHSHYLTAGVLALYFLRLSCNQMATGSIFETANLQCHDVL